jgi:3-oxoadipate enol-lactonase
MTDSIAVNGIDIAYRIDGPDDAPTVVMSNSLASNLTMWDAQVEALVPRYRVVRYDTRGHGNTSATGGGYSIDMLVADLIGLLDALGIEKSAFCGLSLGGMIGQQLGIEHADRFTGLVLADTISRWPEGAGVLWAGRIRAAQQQGMKSLVEGTLERWFTPSCLEARPPEVEKIAQMILNTPVPGYAGCCQAISKINFTGQLGAISLPTLVIVGADDPATPVSAAEVIHQAIAGSELVVIEQASHIAPVEQPAAFNEALLGFLDRL